jgi:hypothetical protein
MRLSFRGKKNTTPATGSGSDKAKAIALAIEPGWNTLVFKGRRIECRKVTEEKDGTEAPFGDWFSYKDRAISIGQQFNGAALTAWHPQQYSISKNHDIRTPAELYDALDWSCVRRVYTQTKPWMEKVNTALMFGLVGVLLFFIYLILENLRGG